MFRIPIQTDASHITIFFTRLLNYHLPVVYALSLYLSRSLSHLHIDAIKTMNISIQYYIYIYIYSTECLYSLFLLHQYVTGVQQSIIQQ